MTGFLNAPWQQRMFLEYETLSLRHTKLQQMLERWEAGTLEATPRSPIKLLQYQSNLMAEYLRILEKRAEIEKIPLVYENLKNLNEVKPQIDQLIQQKKQAKEAFIKTFDPNSLYAPWQQRMVWEYHEVSSQYAKLQQMLEKWEKGKLEETPRSPFELLEYQKEIMDEYLRVLKIRAGMEQFSLSSH